MVNIRSMNLVIAVKKGVNSLILPLFNLSCMVFIELVNSVTSVLIESTSV